MFFRNLKRAFGGVVVRSANSEPFAYNADQTKPLGLVMTPEAIRSSAAALRRSRRRADQAGASS